MRKHYISMLSRLLFCCIFSFFALHSAAQNNEILDRNIKTLQAIAGDEWTKMPVISLGKRDRENTLFISFDDLSDIPRRFTYSIKHCEADWTESESLFERDYMEGFNGDIVIENYEASINTIISYTHYSFYFPNKDCQIKMSGNYELTIHDDDNDKDVAKVRFMVCENTCAVKMSYSPNTDIDNHASHQQVEMETIWNGISPTRPEQQLKTVVLQNGCWLTAKHNAPWQFTTTKGLAWKHCRDLIFDAGNEYHKYEILAVTHPTLGIDRIVWDGKNYNVFPFATSARMNYIYDEDANGAFLIRNSDNVEVDFTTEYVWVKYRLKIPQQKGDIYVSGRFTNESLSNEYKMTYNTEKQQYELSLLQKQGYYNYKFIQRLKDGTLRNMPESGDFYQTKNSYQALIYFKGPSDRSDRLVGTANLD